MANLAKAKYASKCVECGKDLKPGTPIWWEGQAAWCQEHGEFPRGEPDTPEPDDSIAGEVRALSQGVKSDFALVRMAMQANTDELKQIKILLEQIKGQGMQ